MTRYLLFTGWFILATSFFFVRCTDDQVVEMSTLERNLLLTWIALERGDLPRVAQYHEEVQQDWQLARSRYRDVPMRPSLQQSSVRINFWMLALRNAVDYGQPAEAIVSVNLIQNELRALRPRMGLNHPADRLYDFYFQWQDVVAASNDPMMCLLEWKEYEERFELATNSWAEYVANRPHYFDDLFPGYGENARDAEAAALTMSRSLEHFATVLDKADHSLAAEPSQAINTAFFDYLAVITGYPETPHGAAGAIQ